MGKVASVKAASVSEVVDEILQSILATSKKQRQIRSGSFWNKFGFERRTRERVESVKSALNQRKITINLDGKLFGSEKSSELITLKLIEKNLHSASNEEFVSISIENVHKYHQIEARLKHLVEVRPLNLDVTVIFSILFAEIFWNNQPNYEIKPGVFGATRSNWTYHTANAIYQACKTMTLTCKFETLGKRDAVIESGEPNPEMLLVAEWEWDYDDIFGKGKELDKLKSSCKKNKTTDAFLLVYCPLTKYLDYLQRIVEEWISDAKINKQSPVLFLHTVIFEEKGSYREFKRLKTVSIHQDGIDVWSDQYL